MQTKLSLSMWVALCLSLSSCGPKPSTSDPATAPDPVVANDADDELRADSDPTTTAMVVLVQGQERWMGNDTYFDEEHPDHWDGAYVGVPPTLDALAAALPSGAKTALLTYAHGVEVRKPLDDRPLTGAAIGHQRDYSETIGRSLHAGLVDALTILADDGSSEKILVVIGDGGGNKEDIAAELASVITQLQQQRVRTFTVFHETRPGDGLGRRNMEQLGYSAYYAVSSRDDLPTMARAIGATLR